MPAVGNQNNFNQQFPATNSVQPNWSGFTSGQVTFIQRLASDSGMNEGVIAAWCLAEESSSAAQARQSADNHNWLNIGYFDSGPGQIAFNSAFGNPTTAADQTFKFLSGTWGGASSGIRSILSTATKSPQAQISAIQKSGWATSGYPNLPSLYMGLNSTLRSATPGGAANAGGTGALPNDLTSGFSVGDPTNPDEDYWTAMNRIAQERYWYLFSDGETLYLADGPDLMRQTPALSVDRIAQSGNISSLDFTWDNTAWTYAVTHRRRRRIQRKTALAKVTSPVEAQLEYVCTIDEVRAGDVVEMHNCGPGDGKWLVGDCRRSVFDVYSEIDLVIALTPLSETQLNPAGINPNNVLDQYGPGGVVGSIKGYVNPVGNWVPNRIDAGVDGTLSGPYFAPGDSQILQADRSNAGWQGGGYIAGRLTAGPLAGKVWYVAEGITPSVSVGANVKAGTPVGQPALSPYGNSYGHGALGAIETGWADPSTPALPLGFVNNKDDQGPIAIAAGSSFNRFLTKLGAKPGSISGRGVGVAPASLPGGYP